MRRVSIGLLLLIVTPSVTQAYHFDVPLRYRVRYSPYALSYHSTGLVPGGVAYTPYALSFDSSGLAFEGVRYSPYALSYGGSGLVLDYYLLPIPYVAYCPPQPICRDGLDTRSYNHRAMRTSRQARGYTAASPAGRSRQAAREDALTVIRQHLRDNGIHDAQIDRILRIDGKLLSVDFALTGRNLLIKYWDREQIESLSTDSAFNRRVIEKYRRDWGQFAEEYQSRGGRVYAISVSDPQDIVAALRACVETQDPASGPANDSSDQRIMYAKE
jgi:hypothetical protein